MFPPSQSLSINIEAISGITGSISIACWVVVFSPQIIENFRRGTAEGLSITFLVIWLVGDIFNVLGAVIQGVLPTMTILALYYTLADIVLIIQCIYYWRINPSPSEPEAPLLTDHTDRDSEQEPLLSASPTNEHHERHYSILSIEHAHHLSPATPLIEPEYTTATKRRKSASSTASTANEDIAEVQPTSNGYGSASNHQQQSAEQSVRSVQRRLRNNGSLAVWKTLLFNTVAVLVVVFAGVFGWYISEYERSRRKHHSPSPPEDDVRAPLEFSTIGQVFGYLCAVFYLASRVPQILLNFKRKSCEGVSLLFFLFACLGNTTYVLSIVAYEPIGDKNGDGKSEEYWRYMAVNASWLLGSLGTLVLDFMIFVQFFMYSKDEEDYEDVFEEDEGTVRA